MAAGEGLGGGRAEALVQGGLSAGGPQHRGPQCRGSLSAELGLGQIAVLDSHTLALAD